MLRNLWNRLTGGRKTSRQVRPLKHRSLRSGLEPLEERRLLSIVKGPYLQQFDQNNMVVMWETDMISTSKVEYGTGLTQSVTDSSLVKIHEVRVSGLSAGTEYPYRVASGPDVSDTFTFRTAPSQPEDFRFMVYGDTRTNYNDRSLTGSGCTAGRARTTTPTIPSR